MTISGELAWVPDPLRFPFLVFFACGRRNRGVRGCEARTAGDEKFPAIQSHWLRIGPRNSPPSIIDFADLSAVLVGLPGSGLHLDTHFPGVVGGDHTRGGLGKQGRRRYQQEKDKKDAGVHNRHAKLLNLLHIGLKGFRDTACIQSSRHTSEGVDGADREICYRS